uniref:Cyclin A2-2 n=1 Tax=Dimocarpus longan TaxID=128017 RepID=A0A8G0QY65_9ROSI|nr:cyclin A2-2 [Dimocarpus longan]
MKSQSSITANVGDLNGRITRARAAALRSSGYVAPSKATTAQNNNRRANPKRAALDENNTNVPDNQGLQHKRRAVLQDVTNVCCESSYKNCFNATKIQAKKSKQAKRRQAIVSKVAPSVSVHQVQASSKPKLVTETTKAEAQQEEVLTSLDTNIPLWLTSIRECGIDDQSFAHQSTRKASRTQSSRKKGKEVLSGKLVISCDSDYIDIDSDRTNPLLCSLYAADVHKVLRVAELNRRPSPKFLETKQHDITKTMRGILVDWLVEVSEEYKLEPDTLYLTVYLIDWFLSQNYIQRQRLQLLGITCMLIASKYEEICAPRVEEFCFITDNTYSRDEVLKMESQVIKFFGFQLFAPTAKTFLRRFLRAAQASYKVM